MNRCQEIRAFLTNSGLLDRAIEVTDEDSLVMSGIIDSLAVLELTTFIERSYGINIGSADLVPENFDSLAAVSSFVERKQSEIP